VKLTFGGIRRRLLGISDAEASFARRGFREGDATTREHLEEIGRVFLRGYHAALEDARPDRLARRLDACEPILRGFAYEGAGMGLSLLDRLTPWHRGRLRAFLAGAGASHAYMVHVGAGWAIAQLGGGVERAMADLHPLLGWLAVDGYGFHHGYFGWERAVEQHRLPDRLSGYARRVFDQGLGRSLWFIEGADVSRIAATIDGFPPARRADLWSGAGLACAYAVGVPGGAIEELSRLAGTDRPHLAQGAAFAAQARRRAGNPSAHTERACRVLCGMSADEAANLTGRALVNLADRDGLPAYEVWRARIRANWIEEAATCGSS
jgi:hypothetical protein